MTGTLAHYTPELRLRRTGISTKTAALEGARAGIVANAVTLGVVDSTGDFLKVEMFQKIQAKTAMRKLGEPIDVATLVAFLVSEQCKYVTGQDIHVMGGLDLFTY